MPIKSLMSNIRVLIVDDEKNIRDAIVRYLKLEKITGITAENGLSAKRLLESEPFDAVIIDLKMPGMNGIELLKWIQKDGPNVPAIMISAFGEIKDAVEAMKLGAKDYIVKPFNPEEMVLRLKRLIEEQRNRHRIAAGKRIKQNNDVWISESQESKKLYKLIDKVSKTDSTILITGESGTGKEITARLIHNHSKRAKNPFVPINIGGIQENLLESELFGHEKGAFTGAIARKTGMVELASSGTLFLDEIGDMPLHLQIKLLRFLQERKIQYLGSTKQIPIDVRIIAATNKDINELIQKKLFREDLFFRLNVINIKLPPLRERKEDIPHLVGFLIEKFNKSLRDPDTSIKGIKPDALKNLQNYSYPGNIRELENLIERAFILSESKLLEVKDFDISAKAQESLSKQGFLKDIEKEAILNALRKWEGNRTKTAEELGITRRTLFNKIKEYGIKY